MAGALHELQRHARGPQHQARRGRLPWAVTEAEAQCAELVFRKVTIQVSISAAGIAGICSSTELSENKGCRDALVQVAEIELELLRGLQRQKSGCMHHPTGL
jgi:hypothetical protein